jgi:hypothetical protein
VAGYRPAHLFGLIGLQRFDQPVQHPTNLRGAVHHSFDVLRRREAETTRKFELHLQLTLRTQRDVQLMKKRTLPLAALSRYWTESTRRHV